MQRLLLALVVASAACSPHTDFVDRLDQGVPADGGTDDMDDAFEVQPAGLQTITVLRGTMTPTVSYTATLGGKLVAVAWAVDRGDIGVVAAGPSTDATVTPSGNTGGMLTLRARLGMQTVTRQIFVQLDAGTQNGANTTDPDEQKQIPGAVTDLHVGGGVGGVGGEGLGGAVSDPATMSALDMPVNNGGPQMLRWLYPYDATVWPRGMLAPLLMWDWSQLDADAIKIELATTSGSFKWTGTFAKPAILSMPMTPSGGKFIRHPIPQDVWKIATNTAGGLTPSGGADKLTIKLTVARGGQGFGPISQTWSVAPARLTGTIYYNSYGTSLVANWSGNHDPQGHLVGAAILGIRSGDTGPHVVVGKNSADDSGCRVCHVVSTRGKALIAQAENTPSYLYDLGAADVQGSAVHLPSDGTFAWAAMLSDASAAFTNTLAPSSTNPAISTTSSAMFSYGTPVGAMVQSMSYSGLPAGVAAGYPSFSPDDKYLAYVDATGSLADIHDRPLMLASYDNAAKLYGTPKTLYTPPAGKRIGYPAFLPDASGLLFEHEVRKGVSDTVMVTRNSARSELWWLKNDTTPMPVQLKTLNGVGGAGMSYLPTGGAQHGLNNVGTEVGFDDATLSYEPTVLPIVSGGYAWVVFTSRRLYGNQCVTDPWASNPTLYNLQDPAVAPTKKLWVAAIDLGAPAGMDPSHPAFYLPAQELTAGNSRGFWVLDPCRADGASCESGDQCCNGYCEPDPSNPASLICTSTVVCAGLQEKCKTAADCCDNTNACVNGFCAGSQIL
jgi:hypothetical protein